MLRQMGRYAASGRALTWGKDEGDAKSRRDHTQPTEGFQSENPLGAEVDLMALFPHTRLEALILSLYIESLLKNLP